MKISSVLATMWMGSALHLPVQAAAEAGARFDDMIQLSHWIGPTPADRKRKNALLGPSP